MTSFNYITIHCSASPQGRGDDAETIHSWHMKRGWDGIGYHYVVLEDGEIQRGRPHYWKGAHVGGHNYRNLGICLIGDDVFTDEQYGALAFLLRELLDRYPDVQILGHRDWPDTGKTCPNFDVALYLQSIGLEKYSIA